MSVRLFLPLLLACAAAGYAAGLWITRQWVDRGPAPAFDAGDAQRARRALADVRSIPEPDARGAARRAFLEAWPESWLRAPWTREAVR